VWNVIALCSFVNSLVPAGAIMDPLFGQISASGDRDVTRPVDHPELLPSGVLHTEHLCVHAEWCASDLL
jgi:hypothetical protein